MRLSFEQKIIAYDALAAVGNSLAFWTNLPFHEFRAIVANKKVALSALGEILLRKVVKKVDNAKITT
jgi:hypothetical protein